MASGWETTTVGASIQALRIVNGSPYRLAQRRRNAVGRATHSAVCRARGSAGPGGSTWREYAAGERVWPFVARALERGVSPFRRRERRRNGDVTGAAARGTRP